ncbi:hypothetical protein [endosymbiont GvMRE of Glomus versiforme]|uniref:hypothetical protein n=1 Tax=endosymbiont GvMRE of Glomus versiforme TaxID=2039283 RepID=UPI000EEB601A|nr:hypothetical protein [endosymbiont GvMRE of Glomus versiforme]RHZ36015.1 hypothetical protein GvMRE_Ic3g83 [endosymbiont GvMRE of Glomus versiforme]
MTKYKNAQEWLNCQYSNRNQVETIEFDSNLNFKQSSELIIDGFSNLKRIRKNYVSAGYSSLDLTKIVISNCLQLEIVCIDGFKNIQQLILNNLPSLKKLNCSHDSLAEIKFIDAGEKLEHLDLGSNNFSQDLSFMNHLVNLKELDLRINNFTGSLEHLKGMNKLKKLFISDTDLDSGLEYLSDSLEDFYCPAIYREDAKSQNIYNLFAKEKIKVEEEWDRKIKDFSQKLQAWKKANPELVIKAQKEIIESKSEKITQLEEELQMEREELQMEREEFEKALQKAKEWRERQLKEIAEQKDKVIEDLKKQVSQLQSQLDNLQVQEQQAQVLQSTSLPGSNK